MVDDDLRLAIVQSSNPLGKLPVDELDEIESKVLTALDVYLEELHGAERPRYLYGQAELGEHFELTV